MAEKKSFPFIPPENFSPVFITCCLCMKTTMCVHPDNFQDYAILNTFDWYCLNCRNKSREAKRKYLNWRKPDEDVTGTSPELDSSFVHVHAENFLQNTQEMNSAEEKVTASEDNESASFDMKKNVTFQNLEEPSDCAKIYQSVELNIDSPKSLNIFEAVENIVRKCVVDTANKLYDLQITNTPQTSGASNVKVGVKNDADFDTQQKQVTQTPESEQKSTGAKRKDPYGCLHFKNWQKTYAPKTLFVKRDGTWKNIDVSEIALQDLQQLPQMTTSYLDLQKLKLIDLICLKCNAPRYKSDLPMYLQFDEASVPVWRGRYRIPCQCPPSTPESPLPNKFTPDKPVGGPPALTDGYVVKVLFENVTRGFDAPDKSGSDSQKGGGVLEESQKPNQMIQKTLFNSPTKNNKQNDKENVSFEEEKEHEDNGKNILSQH